MLCFYMFLSWKVLSDIGSCGLSNPRGNFFWRITRMYPLKNHRDNLISFVLPHAQKYQQYYPHFCSPQGRGCVSKKYCKKSQKACQPVGRFHGAHGVFMATPWGLRLILASAEGTDIGDFPSPNEGFIVAFQKNFFQHGPKSSGKKM